MFLWFVSCDTDHNSSSLCMLWMTLNMHCLTSHNYTKVLVLPVTGSHTNLSTPGVVVHINQQSCYTRTTLWQLLKFEYLQLLLAWPRDSILLQLPPVCQHQQLKRNSAMALLKCSTEPARQDTTREREGDQTILLLLHISQLLRRHSLLLRVGKFPLCPIPTATSNLSTLLCLESNAKALNFSSDHILKVS